MRIIRTQDSKFNYLQFQEETDFKQQEISESKDLFAESNHLLNQLQNQNFALMASVGESDSKKFFENDTCHCARDSEVARLVSFEIYL